MKMKDYGGPAFPVQDAANWQSHGLSIRDYFAAKAMQSEMQSNPGIVASEIASLAYEMADAMLKAREEGGAE